jgi:two-component system, NarL family, response regulator DevR
MAKQRILLVDDHEVVRLGLRALLEHHPQFEVVEEAGTAREAIEQTARHRPRYCSHGYPASWRVWY